MYYAICIVCISVDKSNHLMCVYMYTFMYDAMCLACMCAFICGQEQAGACTCVVPCILCSCKSCSRVLTSCMPHTRASRCLRVYGEMHVVCMCTCTCGESEQMLVCI